MAKKRSVKKIKPEHFKMSPHDHPQHKVFFYIILAVFLGVALGWFFSDQFLSVFAYTP
jgi:hypothetical protein